jgi:hypothetical protein
VALTVSQIASIRREVGETPDDTALNEAYDRLGDIGVVIIEIIERRLANLESSPAAFNVPGEYGQSTEQNMIALREKLSRLRGMVDPSLDVTAAFQTGVRVLNPKYRGR